MKNDSTVTFLNYVLAVLVVFSVGFAMLTSWRDHKLPQLAPAAMQANNNFQKLNAVLNDAMAYYNANGRSPELGRILQAAQQKPAAK
ncbi:MAG TPA: hypothetical protein VGO57_07010 [Verrucomicrobiae bacterium]